MKLTHMEAQLQALKAIPAPKRRTKVLRTMAGIFVFGAAWFLPQLGFPQLAAYVVGGFGAFIVSQDIVSTFARLVPAVVRDLVLAFRGGGANGPTR
jgi:hypothetical protein